MSNITYDEIFLNDSNVLMFRPKLACAIGLHEAIIVNQIEYWVTQIKQWKEPKERDRHYRDGKWWVYNSLEEWHSQFPFISKDLLQRKLVKMKKDGILFATSQYNTASFDRTLWYSINYEKLASIVAGIDIEPQKSEDENASNDAKSQNSLISPMSGFSRDGSRDFPETYTRDYSTETTINTVSIDDKSESNNKKAKSVLKAKSSPSRAIRTSSNFDVSLKKTLSNMRRAVGNDNDFAAMKYLTEYFFSAIALRCDKIHHVLSVKQCDNIYATLKERFTPLNKSTEDITWQIQYYLHDFVPRMDTPTMEHFATDGILTIGDYRLQNLDISDEDIDYRAYYISKHPDCLMAQEARKQILASAT